MSYGMPSDLIQGNFFLDWLYITLSFTQIIKGKVNFDLANIDNFIDKLFAHKDNLTALNIINILNQDTYIQDIIRILNNQSDKTGYYIQNEELTNIQIEYMKNFLIEYIKTTISDIDIQKPLKEFLKNEKIYNIIEVIFNMAQEMTSSYPPEKLQEFSTLSYEELLNETDDWNESILHEEFIKFARDARFLLYLDDESRSYKDISIRMIEVIIHLYLNSHEQQVKDYNNFLQFMHNNIQLFQPANFIQLRRKIIEDNQYNGANSIDPIVEAIIVQWFNAQFSQDSEFLDCNLRKSLMRYVDDHFGEVCSKYLDHCISYIFEYSKTEKNNFVDKVLNAFFKKYPQLIDSNIDITTRSFAKYKSDYIPIKNNKTDTDVTEKTNTDVTEKTNTDVTEPINTDKNLKKINQENDPNTWTIEYLYQQLKLNILQDKQIQEIIADNTRFFPTENGNNTWEIFFIHEIQQAICDAIRSDKVEMDSFSDSHSGTTNLLKAIRQYITDKLPEQFITSRRREILNRYFSGRDPKIDAIISYINEKLQLKFKVRKNYVNSSEPLYSTLFQKLNSLPELNARIDNAFYTYFYNQYIKNIKNNKNNRLFDQSSINSIYIKNFPQILAYKGLNNQNRQDKLLTMYSKEQLNNVITNAYEQVDQLFMDKSLYDEFTIALIKNILKDYSGLTNSFRFKTTINDKLSTIFNEINNRIKEKEVELLKTACNIRSDIFKSKIDPFVLAIAYKLFPDLKSIDTINSNHPIIETLKVYINRSAITWNKEKLKNFINNRLNFLNNSNNIHNKIFLQAIQQIQQQKAVKYIDNEELERLIQNTMPIPDTLPEETDNIEKSDFNTEETDDTGKIDISNLTLEQLNSQLNNQLTDIITNESSFLPEELLYQFCASLSLNIYRCIRLEEIDTKEQFMQTVNDIVKQHYKYSDIIKIRNKLLQNKNVIEPLLVNIYNQFPNLKPVNQFSNLYKDIQRRINDNLFQNIVDNILKQYILTDNNKIYHEKAPQLFTNANESDNNVDKNDNVNKNDNNADENVNKNTDTSSHDVIKKKKYNFTKILHSMFEILRFAKENGINVRDILITLMKQSAHYFLTYNKQQENIILSRIKKHLIEHYQVDKQILDKQSLLSFFNKHKESIISLYTSTPKFKEELGLRDCPLIDKFVNYIEEHYTNIKIDTSKQLCRYTFDPMAFQYISEITKDNIDNDIQKLINDKKTLKQLNINISNIIFTTNNNSDNNNNNNNDNNDNGNNNNNNKDNKIHPDIIYNEYILDNYTLKDLIDIKHSYDPSFLLGNEIIKAILGHIESFNGESYKRIFDPLFQGEFKKQLPEMKSALLLLNKVQLTTLIANDRNRFAEFCRIFLYNISDNKHKFIIDNRYNQQNKFTKQLRHYLLHNQTIIKIINKRLYNAFQKYYNAYINMTFDKNKYDQSFNNLSFASEIKDTKGSVNQFNKTYTDGKIIVLNDQVHIFHNNISFEDYIQKLDANDIYNYAYGYIINNCVFLEPLTNISEDEVTNILTKYTDPFDKIYLTINKDNNILTERRLARLAATYQDIVPKELYKIDDINAHVLLTNPADVCRTRAFVYFNGKIYGGRNHITIIYRKLNVSEELQEKLTIYRAHNDKSIFDGDNTISVAFGHIQKHNVGIIEDFTLYNCTIDEVKNSLIATYNCEKIYTGSEFKLKELNRIAYRINKRFKK